MTCMHHRVPATTSLVPFDGPMCIICRGSLYGVQELMIPLVVHW